MAIQSYIIFTPCSLHYCVVQLILLHPPETYAVCSLAMPLLSARLLSFTIQTASLAFCPFCPLLSLPLTVYVKFALFLCCCSTAYLPPTCSVHTPHQLSSSSPWGVNRCCAYAGWSGGTRQHMLLLQPLLNTGLDLMLFSANK